MYNKYKKNQNLTNTRQDDQIVFAGSTAAFLGGNAAIRGEQLGVIVGRRIARDADGNFLVNSAGNYAFEDNIVLDDGRSITPIIGNPNPDYIMNWNNSISYKNFSFNFQISHTVGGDIASSTIATLFLNFSI